jgi:hypothetical protein
MLVGGGRKEVVCAAYNTRIISPSSYIADIASAPKENRIAMLEYGSRLEVQAIEQAAAPRTVWKGKGYPAGVVWSPNGKFIALVLVHDRGQPENLDRVLVLRTSDWRQVAKLPLKNWASGNPQFDSTSSVLAVSSGPKTILWLTSTWRTTTIELPGWTGEIRSLSGK